jgi:hypothetical protein
MGIPCNVMGVSFKPIPVPTSSKSKLMSELVPPALMNFHGDQVRAADDQAGWNVGSEELTCFRRTSHRAQRQRASHPVEHRREGSIARCATLEWLMTSRHLETMT